MKSNKPKSPDQKKNTFRVSKRLNAYSGKVIFTNKLAKANRQIAGSPLPA